MNKSFSESIRSFRLLNEPNDTKKDLFFTLRSSLLKKGNLHNTILGNYRLCQLVRPDINHRPGIIIAVVVPMRLIKNQAEFYDTDIFNIP